MRSFLVFYFFVIFILSICLVFMIRNKDFLLKLKFIQDYQQNEVQYDRETQPENESGCKFGFGFLRKLQKDLKPIKNDKLSQKLLQRPVSGAIRQRHMCADSMDGIAGDSVSIGSCHGQGRNQEWTLTKHNQIRSEGHGTLCLSWDEKKRINIVLQHCNDSSNKQKWLFDTKTGHFKVASNPGLCIDHFDNKLSVIKCNPHSQTQNWSFIMTEILNIELQAKNDQI